MAGKSFADRIGGRKHHHQPNRPVKPLRERGALDLCRAELGLEIDERRFDLQVQHFLGMFEHDIGGPSRRVPNRNLQ